MVGNSNRDSEFSSEKFTDSLQTESINDQQNHIQYGIIVNQLRTCCPRRLGGTGKEGATKFVA